MGADCGHAIVANGASEILGGLFYPVQDIRGSIPAVRVNDAAASASFMGISFRRRAKYPVLLPATRNGGKQTAPRNKAPIRWGGHVAVPLCVSRPDAGGNGP